MQVHQLQIVARKKKKTIGRGGKRGTYSGRGCKGQKARSGGNVDPLFEGGRSSLTERLKKVRGFTSIHSKKNILTLDALDRNFSDGDSVSLEKLVEMGAIKKGQMHKGVKILSSGELTKKLIIAKNIDFSEGARAQIEKIGGKIEE